MLAKRESQRFMTMRGDALSSGNGGTAKRGAFIESVPIHRALTRSNLFLGGDREMVMFSGLIAGTMVFYAFEWKSAVVGVLFWTFSIYILRLMAKHDPKLRDAYMRHRRYQSYYPPMATPWRVNTESQGKQYRDPWKLT